MMKKTLVAGTVVLTLAGAGLAFARPHAEHGWRPNAEDTAAFTDARIAGLKAGLKLTPDQEKNWPAVEGAIRDLAKQRTERMQQRHDRFRARREARRNGDDNAPAGGPDAIGRLRQSADALSARADSLKKLADASAPLYQSLDDGQKHRFAMLIRMSGQSGGGHRGNRWHHRGEEAR